MRRVATVKSCALLAAILFASCASTPALVAVRPQHPAAARVYIVDDGGMMYHMIQFMVYVDGRRICALQGGQYAVVDLEPGAHRFELEGTADTDLNFAAGSVTYLRISLVPATKPASLVVMDAKTAQDGIAKLDRVESALPQFSPAS